MQTVEDLEDALFQGSASHYRVVDDDEIVLVGTYRTVGDVIDMGCQIVTFGIVGNEGAQFDVFPNHFFDAHVSMQFPESVGHAVECHLGGVGDIGKDGMINVSVDGLEDGRCQLFTQTFAFLIDVAVGAATEVDTFEGTCRELPGGHNLFEPALSVSADDKCLAGLEFVDVVGMKIKGRLQYRSLAGESDDFVIAIVKRRTDAPGVAHGKHLAAACQSTHHVASIVVTHRGAQHVANFDMIVDISGEFGALKSLFLGFDEESFHLAVEAMSHQFERDI